MYFLYGEQCQNIHGAHMKDSIIKLLEQNLAETYTQELNIQKCHWNVEGARFHALHVMFEGQYKVLFEYVDVLAERIRALEAYAPGSFDEFTKLSDIQQIKEKTLDADTMIHRLLDGYKILVQNLGKTAELASKSGDRETEDMMVGQIETHQKNMWMLRSMLSTKGH